MKRISQAAAAPTAEGSELAGIEYHGVAGSSEDCRVAVLRLIQYPPPIRHARIVTNNNQHCLLLKTELGDMIAVKSGFASGYGGEGPAAFSAVLQLLLDHMVNIDEVEVDERIIERIDRSGLTSNDLERLTAALPMRPGRWGGYISDADMDRARAGGLGGQFWPIIPFAIVDPRIMDLAEGFWSDPDARLMTAYRRLEDIVRERTGLPEHNARLFSAAFSGETAPLTWDILDKAERQGRANLFCAVFMAYRNPRAHGELRTPEAVSEFLLINQLFKLEREAIPATNCI